jgi:flagella basal body P-ring formation protein FlgA
MLARRRLVEGGRFTCALIAAWLLAAPDPGLQGREAADVDAAIARALEERLGPGTEVAIDAVEIVGARLDRIVSARLAPGARLGAPLPFRLATAGARGSLAWTSAARVHARIIIPHAHAVRPLARGAQLTSADLEAARHEITAGPISAWPQPEDLARGRVLRDLAAGACIPRAAVSMPYAVQNGEAVVAVVRVGGVEATARLIAVDSGDPGAIIRVVNADSRRVMKARIVSAGTVEVLQ